MTAIPRYGWGAHSCPLRKRKRQDPAATWLKGTFMTWEEATLSLGIFWLLSLWICSSVQTSLVVYMIYFIAGFVVSHMAGDMDE